MKSLESFQQMLARFSLCFMLISVGACSKGRDDLVETLKTLDRRVLLKELQSRSLDSTEPWSPQLARLHPKGISISAEGTYITTWRCFSQSAGLFVPNAPDFVPASGTDPSYEELGPQLFWFFARG